MSRKEAVIIKFLSINNDQLTMGRESHLLPLLLTLLLILIFTCQSAAALKIYRSRQEFISMLGQTEGRLYLGNCEQSTRRFTCIYAIDESYSQEPTQCAVTEQQHKPWWMGILETPAYISKITVLNIDQTYRSYPDALRGITIMAGDDICFRFESDESFIKRSFPCDVIADQITIQSNRDNAVLTLCDIEVFGAPSSVGGNGYCQNAFDGNAQGDHNANPCAMTSDEFTPWLEAKLWTPSLVTEVRVYNRLDCCKDSLTNITVTLNNRVCSSYDGEPEDAMSFDCKFFGDRVRIKSKKNQAISICELQIIGYPMEFPNVEKFKALGCYKDNPKNRDLTQLVSSIIMSQEKCHKMCKRLGLKYFGVQNGMHCWCGSTYGKHGKADEKMCSIPCEDNEKQRCGGSIYNSIFEIL
uniref:WSC domain-containing protein n=1 Tax=Macrostomum lignano TaxID=282301 RepID=A0A1I8G237_9PLAT